MCDHEVAILYNPVPTSVRHSAWRDCPSQSHDHAKVRAEHNTPAYVSTQGYRLQSGMSIPTIIQSACGPTRQDRMEPTNARCLAMHRLLYPQANTTQCRRCVCVQVAPWHVPKHWSIDRPTAARHNAAAGQPWINFAQEMASKCGQLYRLMSQAASYAQLHQSA